MGSLATVRSACTAVLDVIEAAGVLVARLALVGIVLAYVYEVVARYAFDTPTWWSAELVKYLLCVLVFTVMPHVTSTRGQVAVTVVLEALPEAPRAMAGRVLALVGFAVCTTMTVFATEETARQIARNIQMMAAQPIPKWWVSVWIVFGFALSALAFLRLAMARQPAAGPAPRPET